VTAVLGAFAISRKEDGDINIEIAINKSINAEVIDFLLLLLEISR